jgi:hypothetical protein
MATPGNSINNLLLQVVEAVNQLQSDSTARVAPVAPADSMARQTAILAERRRLFEPYNARSRRNNHAGVSASMYFVIFHKYFNISKI